MRREIVLGGTHTHTHTHTNPSKVKKAGENTGAIANIPVCGGNGLMPTGQNLGSEFHRNIKFTLNY